MMNAALRELGTHYIAGGATGIEVGTIGKCDVCGGTVSETNWVNVVVSSAMADRAGLKRLAYMPPEVWPCDDGYCCDECLD